MNVLLPSYSADEGYAGLQDDDKRKAVWLSHVPLGKTHELRARLNDGQAPTPEVLGMYDPTIIASVLKLYFLELPGISILELTSDADPIVSFTVYDIVKSIYTSANHLEDTRSRISAIQNTLSQLRVTNIATLDALTQHFGRLIDIAKADEEWLNELAQNLAYCTLSPIPC